MPKSLFGCLILAAVVPSATAIAAQCRIEADRPSGIRDAVVVARVTMGYAEVHCGLLQAPAGNGFDSVTPVEWGSDWLKNMDIVLFNRTDKVIDAGRIDLFFPEIGNARPQGLQQIDLGRIPAAAAYYGSGRPILQDRSRKPLSWRPGEALVVHVGDSIDRIGPNLQEAMPSTGPTQVVIRLGPFYFDDGMKWAYGAYALPDPQHLGQWQPQPVSFFPGDRLNNWPPGHKWAEGGK